jgi:hypothetical protein
VGRWGLVIWILFGLTLLGVKAMLDLSSARYPDVAIRAGAATYFIPRTIILNGDSFSADLARVSGCWDVREAGMVQAAASVAGAIRRGRFTLTCPVFRRPIPLSADTWRMSRSGETMCRLRSICRSLHRSSERRADLRTGRLAVVAASTCRERPGSILFTQRAAGC